MSHQQKGLVFGVDGVLHTSKNGSIHPHNPDDVELLPRENNDVVCISKMRGLVGTPIDLGRFLKINKPMVRARYELQEVGRPTLEDVVKGRFPPKQER